MRKLVLLVPLSLVLFTVALSVDGSFYSALLERGKISFREGRYPQAVKELRIAAFGLLDSIANYETALVYLALAQQRTGDAAAAAMTVRKLLDAERVTPTYRSLTLEAPVRTAFEALAATVLTRAELLALTGPAEARPRVVTETPRPEPPVTRTDTAAVTVDVQAERREAERRETERLEQQRRETERLEQQRREAARIEAERIEAERRTTEAAEAERRRREREEAERLESERRETQRRESERIGAARREAERREAQQAEERREAERREAQRRREAERREAERRETERREAERREAPRIVTTSPQPTTRSAQLTSAERRQLNAADEALQRGNLDRAQEIYLQLLNSGRPTRAALLEVARGLYRVGDFRGSVSAFSRVGTLQPGEEQYHYYAAVALFETGSFAAAKRQLACALPFIAMTDDVARYQAKIQAAIE